MLQQLLLILAVLQLGRPQTAGTPRETDNEEGGQCATREELGSVRAELGLSRAQMGRVEEKLQRMEEQFNTWQNTTIHIFKRYLLNNRDKVKLEKLQEKLEQVEEEMSEQFAAVKNISLQGIEQCKGKTLIDEGTADGQMCSLEDVNTALEELKTAQNVTLKELRGLVAQRTIGTYLNPAPSCKALADWVPSSTSGYYWILNTTRYANRVYCDMTRHCCGSTGGWMRVAYLDMTDPTHHCPEGFRLITDPKRSCGRATSTSGGCTTINYRIHGVEYRKVCGRVLSYQYYSPNAFDPYHNRVNTIDDVYVDGVSITHGQSPRKHIWTFAAAIDGVHSNEWVCPCIQTDTPYTGAVPPFVGEDYFCETASLDGHERRLYSDDPLWNGKGCGSTSTCCQFNNPPWFCKELPEPTTDDIELRLCADQDTGNEDAPIEHIELYIQ